MRIGFIGTYTTICGQGIYLDHEVNAWSRVFPEDQLYIASEADIKSKRQVDDLSLSKYHVEECWDRNESVGFPEASEFLIGNKVDIVNVMHEWGLFGFPDRNDNRFIDFVDHLKLNRIPVVVTLFTPAWFSDITPYFKRLQADHYIVQGGLSDLEILINEYGVDLKKCSFIQEPISPFHHKVESISEVRKRLSLPEDRFIFLVTGFWRNEINMKKIVYAFIHSSNIANIKGYKPYLVFAGTYHPTDPNNARDMVRRSMILAAKHNLQDSIMFTNKFHTENELDDYLYACDAVLSYRENVYSIKSITTSGAALRAISARKPLITIDSDGVKQIPNTACLKVKDIQGFMDAMNWVVDIDKEDSKYVSIVQEADKFYQEHSCDATVPKYRKLFESVINDRVMSK